MLTSLKSKVISIVFILIILPIFLGAIVIYNKVKNTELAQLERNNTQVIKHISTDFENYVRYNVDLLKQTVKGYSKSFQNKDELKNLLTLQLMSNNSYDEIIFLTPDGMEIAHAHRYSVENLETHSDYAHDITFIFPKLNRSIYFSHIQFAEDTGEPVADVSFSIKNSQTDVILGVIIAKLRLKPVWNMLANINMDKGQQIYVLDHEGRLVAHPNPSMVLKGVIFTPNKMGFTRGINGNKVFMKYIKINIANQVFTIVSEQNSEDAQALLRSISIIIIFVGIAAFALIAILLYITVKHVVEPIDALSAAAVDIEMGNLDRVVEVNGQDEIRSLAKAFNKMTSKLKENTAQLKSFNIGLQNKIQAEIEKTRKMEQVLFEQKKFADMGEMINAIAHQWRQPLNNIGLIQQYLHDGFKNGTITPEEYEEYTNDQIAIVQNMSSTIDDFRTFFTSDKQRDRFNIINALGDFIKLSSAQLSSNGIRFRIQCNACSNRHIFDIDTLTEECQQKELEVIGHSGEFKQVIQNIIANAKDAFEEHKAADPFLIISVDVDDSNVIIRFRDNAQGIPIDILPNIFDPYFTTKEEGKGTGIGLYISKVIIDNHFGGLLRAVNVEGGAEFIITIPRAKKD